MRFLILAVAFMLIAGTAYTAGTIPRIDPSGRSGEPRPDLLEKELPAPPASLTTPAPAPPLPEEKPSGQAKAGVFVKKITITGSTIFSAQELAEVTKPYENRTVTMEDLETLRRALTHLYINRGYVNSGAVIPDQTVADGTITISVIEGTLSRIDIEGTTWFREKYLKDRIALGIGTPVNVSPLQDRLQLLQQDQRIERVNAELRPGARPGDSELSVLVEEKPPMSATFAFNNYQSPSIGAERGLVTLEHQNLTGNGDILSFTYGRSKGLDANVDAWYTLPFTVYDTALILRYWKNNYTVVETPFDNLDIVSRSDSYEVGLRQPLYRSLSQEFAVSASYEHEINSTFMDCEPFSFYPGVENGRSTANPIRFSQEWIFRTQRQVFSFRSRFSFGLSGNHATINYDNLPDGRFFAWLGQFQWARITDFHDTQLLFRLDTQMANDSLLPLEQMSIGGRYSVRGYRENYLVRDQALITSLEARFPVLQNQAWADYLQLCPFYDYGRGDNVDLPTGDPRDIASAGMGVRWASTLQRQTRAIKAETEVYWGIPFTSTGLSHEDLQDSGIHFQFAITGFF